MQDAVIAVDQGTTSCRAVLYDAAGKTIDMVQEEFRQYYPQPGWVEHDAEEIWHTQWGVLKALLDRYRDSYRFAAVGITNQRETTVLWDRRTGKPVSPAIVWQDRRTADICERLKREGLEAHVRRCTGLVIDAYFSATKISWILEQHRHVREAAEKGHIAFGTIDSWLIWNLTNGRVHATDPSNASRTMLFDIVAGTWDPVLLETLDIPESILPQVRPSAGDFGHFEYEGLSIPIRGVAGDQQAALFGQGGLEPGTAKNTYGTGCFLLMSTGERLCTSQSGLLTTIAWGIDGRIEYALEGSVFVAGAAIQWLRDGLRIIETAPESETIAQQARSTEGIVVVPAFAGLGAPYWDMYARGAIFGLTRDTRRAEIVKATLESLAFQTRDILDAMQEDAGFRLKRLRVDGGASANDMLMQFQADILGSVVERPGRIEATAFGAACLAGMACGLWDRKGPKASTRIDRIFLPEMAEAEREKRYRIWKKAVSRTLGWVD
ncbi:MAG: glycerol kinase GlpK [Thermodesulfobacteriota bacterium]